MKKIAVTTVAVISLLATQANADAAVSKQSLPDLTDKTTISQIKSGTYSFKGITFKSTHADVVQKLGKPQTESYSRSVYGARFVHSYGDYAINIGGESHQRYDKFDKIKVNYLGFNYDKPIYSYQSLKSLLGKPQETFLIDNGTKDIRDDSLVQQYAHFMISYNRLSGKWLVSDINLGRELKQEKTSSKSGKLLNKNIRKLSAADYKAMKEGCYKLEGVQPGMTKEQVYKLIGESTNEILLKNDALIVSQQYGKDSALNLEYSSKNLKADVNKLKLRQMIYTYYEEDVRLADILQALGKPTSTKNDSFVVSEDGKKERHVSIKTFKYGSHLEITAEKSDKYWIVNNVVYR